jgi:hypothetical protein
MGYKDVNQFWKPIDMAALQQQMAQQPDKPDPNMILAQAQMAKAQGDVENAKQKNMIEAQQLQITDAREREKARIDALVRMQGIEAQWGAQMSDRDQQAETARSNLLGDLLKHSTAESNRVAQEAQSSDHQRGLGEIDRAVTIHDTERDRQFEAAKHARQLQHDMAKHRLTLEAQQQIAAQKAQQGPTDA